MLRWFLEAGGGVRGPCRVTLYKSAFYKLYSDDTYLNFARHIDTADLSVQIQPLHIVQLIDSVIIHIGCDLLQTHELYCFSELDNASLPAAGFFLTTSGKDFLQAFSLPFIQIILLFKSLCILCFYIMLKKFIVLVGIDPCEP